MIGATSTNDLDPGKLVGRERELAQLTSAIAAAAAGRGGLLLLAGEPGVGKTRLVKESLAGGDVLKLEVSGVPGPIPPYGPVIAALRSYLRVAPTGLDDGAGLSRYLALLLPELGDAPEHGDQTTLFEAIRHAFSTIARRGPAAVFLDDLQWADNTTLRLLPSLADALENEPLLLIGAYRNDEIPRDHALRRMRADLRRAGHLSEVVLEPLDAGESAALAAHIVGRPLGAVLATTLFDRTQGIPLFVEELTQALVTSGRLRDGPEGVELVGSGELPIPETVRDAVLLRAESLSATAREALDAASAAGVRFNFDVVADLADGDGLEEAIGAGFIVEVEQGQGAFRHALVRDALYDAIPWRRRRALHGGVASRLQSRGAPAAAVAEHWLAAGESERTRRALTAALHEWCALHAYRDAAEAGRRALELWHEDDDEPGRLAVLTKLGECAELSGDFREAARAWREAAEGYALSADVRALAEVERRLAGLHELQCQWHEAFAARAAAAAGFGATGLPGEAAAERLAAAANLQSAGALTAAEELIGLAAREAERADRTDLKARSLGLEGLVRARLGDVEAGLELARTGLSLALAENLTGPAAEIYERIGMILENSSDYRGAADAWSNAFDFCEAHGVSGKAHLCLGCLAYVFRKTGEWKRATAVCRQILTADDPPRAAQAAAVGVLGLVHILRGEARRGRPLLSEAFALAQRIEFMIMKIDGAWGLARADALEGSSESAAARCRLLLELTRTGEDSHYPVASLRWAATFFASQGARGEAGACAEELARIAALTGNAEAIGALAHALGELSLLDDDPEQAAAQFTQALDFVRDLELPMEHAETQLRAGVALVSAGDREAGIERLTDAYHAARKLGARPLAAEVAETLSALGEQVDRRPGGRTTAGLERGGLSRRELQVLRLVAAGRTNREIASDLFLSQRTVDMHLRNILRKLDCRSRVEATRKAGEFGLL